MCFSVPALANRGRKEPVEPAVSAHGGSMRLPPNLSRLYLRPQGTNPMAHESLSFVSYCPPSYQNRCCVLRGPFSTGGLAIRSGATANEDSKAAKFCSSYGLPVRGAANNQRRRML